jgi:hypothetical protein
LAENRSIQPPFLWHVPPQAGCCRVEWTRAARTRWRSLASRIALTHHQLVDRHQQARTSTAGDRQSARAFSMTSRSGLRAGRHRRPPHPADLAERNIPDSTARKAAGVVGRTLSIANGRAPAGGHGPIGPWSSCRSSRPSRGRRHRRSGTSRTDGDTQACRPRDFAYLWVVEHGGAGSGSRPCETTACSAAAGCRVDRLRPDKPGRLHRSRPQARAAGQAGIGRGVSPRSGEVSVSLDVTEHAELERDSRGARAAHPPEW